MKENLRQLISGWWIVLPLLLLNIYLWTFKTPDFNAKDPDKIWCENNQGHWINSYRNQHCEWVPEFIKK